MKRTAALLFLVLLALGLLLGVSLWALEWFWSDLGLIT